MFLNTESLIAASKLSEFFPTGQGTFNDPVDLISFANQEMQIKIVPVVMSVRQSYFGATMSRPLKNNLNHYAFPERAIGNAVEDVFFCPNSAQPYTRWALSKLQIHDVQSYSSIGGTPSGMYIQGDEVIVVPTPSGLAGTEVLQMPYFMRPNSLVSTSACAKITGSSVLGAQTTFTVDTDLTATLLVGAKSDIICFTSPFRPWATDILVQAITSSAITFNTSDVQDESGSTTPQIGDYICLAQTANIPMIPQEMHPILAEMIAFRCNKALGNAQGMQGCASNIKDMLSGAMKLIENRIASEPDVVLDSSGFLGMLSVGGYRTLTR